MRPFPCLFYALSFLALQSFAQAANHGPIDSAAALAHVMQMLEPGDTVIIADGRHHGWVVDLNARGNAESPVTLRPQTPGGATFTGRNHFSITGSHIVMDGFRFEDCVFEKNLIELDASAHCRVANCLFQNSGGNRAAISILAGSRYNLISECRFVNIAARCVNMSINEAIYEKGIPVGNIIRNNHFQDIPPARENGRETIKLGTDQPTYGHVMAETRVEDNVFLRCDGEAEIISNKCSGNIFRRNVFTQCQGELVMRGGSKCLIEDNRFFDGSGGIRICGTNHIVRNNLVVNSAGTGIRLYFGMTKEQGGHYQAAGNCLIENNTILNASSAGILVGDSRGKDWQEKGVQNVAPENNRIHGNIIAGISGDLLRADHAPRNTIEGNTLYRQGDATISTPGERPIYAHALSR